jgi:hypothetical protein
MNAKNTFRMHTTALLFHGLALLWLTPAVSLAYIPGLGPYPDNIEALRAALMAPGKDSQSRQIAQQRYDSLSHPSDYAKLEKLTDTNLRLFFAFEDKERLKKLPLSVDDLPNMIGCMYAYSQAYGDRWGTPLTKHVDNLSERFCDVLKQPHRLFDPAERTTPLQYSFYAAPNLQKWACKVMMKAERETGLTTEERRYVSALRRKVQSIPTHFPDNPVETDAMYDLVFFGKDDKGMKLPLEQIEASAPKEEEVNPPFFSARNLKSLPQQTIVGLTDAVQSYSWLAWLAWLALILTGLALIWRMLIRKGTR